MEDIFLIKCALVKCFRLTGWRSHTCAFTGGTESILLAIKAYRDQYRERNGCDGTSERPQLICCQSAHAAFAKACEFFDVELVRYIVCA
jgi:glutamate/tyrosine decarboxylase-like PLP-dependent enzyme